MPLFVYGTIRKGQPKRPPAEHMIRSSRQAFVSGELYSLGEYPCLVLRGRNPVAGEVLEFRDEAAALKHFDAVEFEEGYRRVGVMAHLERRAIGAWAYVYLRQPEGAGLIESGDWIEYLKGKS